MAWFGRHWELFNSKLYQNKHYKIYKVQKPYPYKLISILQIL